MSVPNSYIYGKIFALENGEQYGTFREAIPPYAQEVTDLNLRVLAEDECGNYLVSSENGIFLWDHETNELVELAKSETDFLKGCREPKPVEPAQGKVVSAWIDADFARSLGVEVPKGVTTKKP